MPATPIPARKKSETGPCARISQKVWCATPKRPPIANAVQGLEPDDRNRFGVLPNLAPLPLPSSLSRRSTQQKATNGAIAARHPDPRSQKKAKQGLVPEFRNRFGALPRSAPTPKRGPGPRARRPQQVWRATEPGPALASVEFISAEHTTESYQKMQTLARDRDEPDGGPK